MAYIFVYDHFLTRVSMRQAMYKTDPAKAKLVGGEFSPEKCAEEIFNKMDKNNDRHLTLQEFIEGASNDPAIVQLLSCEAGPS